MNVGGWIELVISRTNGATLSVAVTNQSVSASIFDLEQNLVAALNNCPQLQGADGIEAADLTQGWFGAGSFNLRARAPGLEAAAIKVVVNCSFTLFSNPGSEFRLDQNLTDLQPRNHLYLSAGLTNLTFSFLLNTVQMADGFHDLEAVAYEGTSVRTQTRLPLAVRVANTGLSGVVIPWPRLWFAVCRKPPPRSTSSQMAVMSFPSGFTARADSLGRLSIKPGAVFNLDRKFLGPEVHPIYAIIESAGGRCFRTETQFLRL